MEQAANQLVTSEKAEGREVQVVPKPGRRKTRGGRPTKAKGAPKAVYRSLTGQQKVWVVCQLRTRLSEPGKVFARAAMAVASQLSVSVKRVRNLWKAEDFWLDWAEKHGVGQGSPKPGKCRKRGERRGKVVRGSTTTGARQPGSRGYLGRTDYCRELVQAVGRWAEQEQQQGHELFRVDLTRQFIVLLDSEIAKMEDRKQQTGISQEQEAYLAHWKAKAKSLEQKK